MVCLEMEEKMTTACYGRERGSSGKIFIFIFLAILLAIAFSFIKPPDHAIQKHGENTVWQIERCIQEKGVLQTWKNYQTQREALICQLHDNLFGIKIQDSFGRRITSFIKEKMTRVGQVEKYLENSGYTKLPGE